MNNQAVAYIGVDISKESLSFNSENLFTGDIPNTSVEIKKLLKKLRKQVDNNTVLQICYESTGIYGDTLFNECVNLQINVSILNPAKVRYYAKSISINTKTDPIDAYLIRLYSQATNPLLSKPRNQSSIELRKMVVAREALSKNMVALSGTLETVKNHQAGHAIKKSIAFLKKEIKSIDKQIKTIIKEDEILNAISKVLCEIQGVAITTVAKIIAYVPELGTLGRRRAGGIVGLIPHRRESGKFIGKCHIHGGRAEARKALYMPATTAITHNPILRAHYQKLRKNGKSHRVAITAVMHKLFCYMEFCASKWRKGSDFYTLF